MPRRAATVPTAPVVAAGLIGGYATARYTRRRELGGAVLAAAGAWSARSWQRHGGTPAVAALLTVYTAAFGLSHPLAKRIGAWPAVLTVTGVAAGSAWAVSDRHA